MNREQEIKDVIDRMAYWKNIIDTHKFAGYGDCNISAETVVLNILNCLNDYRLINLNRHTKDHDAVDLGDKDAGIAFQVTTTRELKKFKKNIVDFFSSQYSQYPQGIRFVVIRDKKDVAALGRSGTLAGLHAAFEPARHILGYHDLVEAVGHVYDDHPARFRRLRDYLRREIPLAGDTPAPSAALSGLLTPLPPALPEGEPVGRVDELAKLETALWVRHPDRRPGGDAPLLLVNGLGGIGKTELCKWFFRRNYHRFRSALWVNAAGMSLRTALTLALARPFGLGHITEEAVLFNAVADQLRNLGADALVVADNVTDAADPDLELLRGLPAAVLVNSRERLPGFRALTLDVPSEAECRELFYRFYRADGDDESVNGIIGLSGRHTLTVELLAKTAHNAGLTAAALLARLREGGFDLSALVPEGVLTLWGSDRDLKPFYRHLETVFEITGLSAEQQRVAMHLALLPSIVIPRVVIKDLLKLDSLDGVNGLVRGGWLRDDDAGGGLFMHPVLRHVLRTKTNPNAEKCETLIVSLVKKTYNKPADNPQFKKEWLVHCEEVLNHLVEKKETLSILANNLSATYLELGELNKALVFQEKAIEINTEIPNIDKQVFATSYNNLSEIYRALGQLGKALVSQLEGIKIFETIPDVNKEDLAKSYTNLGLTYQDLGQREKALGAQMKAVEIFEELFNADHPFLGTVYNNLSLAYEGLGQLINAFVFQQRAIAIRESKLDANHPDLAKSYGNLSKIYYKLGQQGNALKFQEKAITIKEAVLASNHPSLAISYGDLSMIYQALGQLEKALEFQEKAVIIREAVLAGNHPSLATSYNNLSSIYKALGQLEKALEFQTKAVTIFRGLFPNGHYDLDIFENNLRLLEKEMSGKD